MNKLRSCLMLWLLFFNIPVHAVFNQCPAIGLSQGCAVLITINANGSLTFQTDSSIKPYDGAEDTLVGVVNNSGATVFGIFLTGNNIFGFDGDGAIGASYTGPGTSFSVVDFNSGTVNFDDGLKDQESLWFSLEGSPSEVKLSRTATIDPGHGGGNCPGGRTGATGPTFKDEERNLALMVGTALKGLLFSINDKVILTRETSTICPTLQERAEKANNAHTNVFVSIHFDGAPPAAHGTSVWWDKTSSKTLAEFLVARVSSNLGTSNNGAKQNGVTCPWCGKTLDVLSNTKMAGILVEGAFLSNAGDEAIMHQANAPSLVAQGIFSGIDLFINQ